MSLDLYQTFIAKSRYCRYIPELKRREHWPETVARYFDFMTDHLLKQHGYIITDEMRKELEGAVVGLEIMPSMRALMTAGPALERTHIASYNCAYVSIDDMKAFDEAMYVLLCFHPETLVRCKGGNKMIADITTDDEVVSFNEVTQTFEYKKVLAQFKTQSAAREKVSVELDNGTVIKCTADHKWLTSNRGYVEAQYLTTDDDLVAPAHEIYKHTNKNTGRSYVGHTSKGTDFRFKQHVSSANSEGSSGHNSHFYKSIRKHGADAWDTSVLDFAFSHEESVEKEMSWIDVLNSYENGYNSTKGGEGMYGYKWTDEQRQAASDNAYERTPEHRKAQGERLLSYLPKIIEAARLPENRERQRIANLGDKNPMFGTTKSEATLVLLRAAMAGEGNPFFGKHHSEETKKLLSDAAKERALTVPNPFAGKLHTEETKQKMKDYWAKRRLLLASEKEAA